jgi:hypothetical protein
VLAVARTFTSAVRLLDALSVFRADFRVEVAFAFDRSSAFNAGVAGLLRDEGVRLVPWAQVGDAGFDLAVMASENVRLEQIDAPIVVLPHGIGFHRLVPDSDGPGERLSGVVPLHRLAGKQAWMVVSHPGQRRQLEAEYPEAAARCVVAGDLTFDRLAASVDLREVYRGVLGVEAGQRLVVVTSTWGAGSLIQSWKELPTQLLAELPADEYRVALVLHPNVWFWHSPYQVRLWLADAREGGLLLLPPAGGWQAALVAADVVVGDHGSVTMYAAALGRPVMLAGDQAAARMAAGTAADTVSRAAERLDRRAGLRDQIAGAISGHRPGRHAGLADSMFAFRGQAGQRLAELLYGQLGLAVPPAGISARAVEEPQPEYRAPRSFTVFTDASQPGQVRLWRFPVAAGDVAAPVPQAVRHLCVREDEPDRRLLANAAVIIRPAVTSAEAAGEWVSEMLRRYPACRVAATACTGGCLAGLRDGGRVDARLEPPGDAAVAGSVVYAWLRSGQPSSSRWTVRAGASTQAVTVTLRSA